MDHTEPPKSLFFFFKHDACIYLGTLDITCFWLYCIPSSHHCDGDTRKLRPKPFGESRCYCQTVSRQTKKQCMALALAWPVEVLIGNYFVGHNQPKPTDAIRGMQWLKKLKRRKFTSIPRRGTFAELFTSNTMVKK